MAKITASVYTSHVPAIGAAMDLGKTEEAYWQPLFAGYEYSKQWMKDNKPDVIFLLSDGEFDEPELSREAARAENSGTVIHTIAFISRDGEETLKAIANDNGGTYRFVK